MRGSVEEEKKSAGTKMGGERRWEETLPVFPGPISQSFSLYAFILSSLTYLY